MEYSVKTREGTGGGERLFHVSELKLLKYSNPLANKQTSPRNRNILRNPSVKTNVCSKYNFNMLSHTQHSNMLILKKKILLQPK